MDSSENKKILIVEDATATAEIIKVILKQRGFSVVDIISHGERVLDAVKDHNPDLILMDIILKGEMDGIDAAKEINKYYSIPIIYLTASNKEEILTRAKKTSPYGYIIKPIKEYELYSTVTTALYKFEAEKRINENERKYRLLFENMTDVFVYLKVFFDKDNKIIDAEIIETNKAFEKLFGLQNKSIIGKKITEIIPNIDSYSIEWRYLFSKVIIKKKSQKLNLQINKINKWFSITAFSPDDNLIAIILEDTTEKNIAELMIKESETKFRSITTSAHDAIIMIDNDGYVSFWNKAAEKIFGYNSEEMNNQLLHNIIMPEYLFNTYLKAFSKWKNTGKGDAINKIVELPAIKKDGTEITIELTISSVQIKGKWNAIGIARDITEKKAMIEQLRNKENELISANQDVNNLLSSINSILIGVSGRDEITHWNSTSEKIFGLKAADITGKKVTDLELTWEWASIYLGIMESMSEKKSIFLRDIRYTNQEGEEGFLGITINPIMDKNSTITGFLIYGNDITEKKIMQMELLQSQKLSSIGELASGIAHEINTPTQYVNDNVIFLKNCYSDILKLIKENSELIEIDNNSGKTENVILKIKKTWNDIDIEYLQEEIPLAFEQTIEGLSRIANIVGSMKRFAHPDVNSKTIIDINSALTDTITISKNEWKYVADIVTDFDETSPMIKCNPAEINQVILNLIINASHAIKDFVEADKFDKGRIIISTNHTDANLIIKVRDNGIGIPEDVIDKIFDPFFTTKDVGKGTGQGLAISRKIIVDNHNGRIFAKNSRKGGAEFRIEIPFETN